MEINVVLTQMVQHNSSDMHLKVGRPPLFRKNGDLHPTQFPILTRADMTKVCKQLMTENQAKQFQESLELDFSYSLAGVGRFRVNALVQLGEPGFVFRYIPLEIPNLDQMGLPPVFKDITQKPQGLVLVTGPTGSGKSTTLAAMIENINSTRPVHIVTIEDPVEFVYSDKVALINQRYVGHDTLNMTEALRRALRQDPDVILFGELRDNHTAEIAVSASETGHLVFSTLHTNDAKQSVDRLIDLLKSQGNREHILNVLSLVLEAIISQRLLKKSDGYGRIAACEIMIMSPHIRQMMQQDKIHDLEKAIAKSQNYYRMQTFNQALAELIFNRQITEEEALTCTSNPDELRLELRGVSSGGLSSYEQTHSLENLNSSASFKSPPTTSPSSASSSQSLDFSSTPSSPHLVRPNTPSVPSTLASSGGLSAPGEKPGGLNPPQPIIQGSANDSQSFPTPSSSQNFNNPAPPPTQAFDIGSLPPMPPLKKSSQDSQVLKKRLSKGFYDI